MKYSSVLYFFVLFYTLTSSFAVNYCDFNEMCEKSFKRLHIACGNDGKIKCQGAKVVKMTSDLKDLILDEHNKHRSQVASGNLKSYKPAARMATMTWDDELAYLAELNVKTCESEHDCHKTHKYPYSGQNLGGMKPIDSYEQFVQNRTQAWFNEYKNAIGLMEKYVFTMNNGHFAAVVKENNYKVGCAILDRRSSGGQVNCACNYASTIMPGRPIYTSGSPASKCKTGKNPKYPSLCNVDEKYEPA